MVSLNTIVSDMGRMLRRVIREDIELVANLAPDIGHVIADPSQLEQVLINLVVNAREAMPAGGTITIETSNAPLNSEDGPVPARVMLSVSDDGQGMSPETVKHIFEPFFTTKPFGKGTGLGLATVYGIVKQTGGDVEVVSELGKGTTFRLYLPLIAAEPFPASQPAPVGTAPGGCETLLLVEDEESVREFLARALRVSGYRVFEAPNGAAALQFLLDSSERVDLVITDLVMPVLGGQELAVRVGTHFPSLPILFISGYSETDLGEEHRANFLQKPFTPQDLTRKVRDVLDA